MGSWHQTQAWSCLGLWAGGRGARCSLRSCVHSTRDNHCLGRGPLCLGPRESCWAGRRRSSGGCLPSSSAAGTPGQARAIGSGVSSSSEGLSTLGTSAWGASSKPRRAGQESYCVSVLTPQHLGKPPRAMGASPRSTGLGRAPRKPGRRHGRSWALPGSCCSHPCPRSRAPNSSGATRGAFHICHPDPGLQIRFLFPSHGLSRAPVACGGLVPSAPESS